MNLEDFTPAQLAQMAELANKLATNPKTRGDFLRMTKEVNPDTHIPEVDIPAAMEAKFKPTLDRLAQLEEQQARREAEDRVRQQRKAALKVEGVSSDDMPKIEKLMVERGIADHKTAAEFYVLQNRQAEPTPAAAQATRVFGPPKTPDLKEFNGNMSAWAKKNAFDMIDQLRGRRTA